MGSFSPCTSDKVYVYFNQDNVISPPVSTFQLKLDSSKPNPKLGVGVLEYNCTGSLLATRNDNQPSSLWLWDVAKLSQIALIQQVSPIKMIEWNPLQPERLAFCCSNGFIYLWDLTYGCEAIQVPAGNFC